MLLAAEPSKVPRAWDNSDRQLGFVVQHGSNRRTEHLKIEVEHLRLPRTGSLSLDRQWARACVPKHSHFREWIGAAVILLSVPVLFVASCGPVWSIGLRSGIPADALFNVYRPLPTGFQLRLLKVWGRFDKLVELAAHLQEYKERFQP